MKQCSKCKEWKELSEFASSKISKDKLQYWCRKCQTEYSRTDKRKESMKRYSQSNTGKYHRRQREKTFLQTNKGKLYRSQKGRRHREKDPIGQKAKAAVNNAVKNGIIPSIHTMICKNCGKQAEHYHHWSYEREHWLDVIPLCFNCHIKEHSF